MECFGAPAATQNPSLAWEYIAGISEIIEKLLVLWNWEPKHFIARLKRRQHDCATWRKLSDCVDDWMRKLLTASWLILLPVDHFANTAPTATTTNDDYQDKAGDDPTKNFPELAQWFKALVTVRVRLLMTHVSSNSATLDVIFIESCSISASIIVVKIIRAVTSSLEINGKY